jgi:hypothetical protein
MDAFSVDWIIRGSLIDTSLFSVKENSIVQSIDSSDTDFIDVSPTLTKAYLIIVRKNDSGFVMHFTITN